VAAPRAPRRTVLLGAAALTLPRRVQAQREAWPARPVAIVVPFPPGGATDVVARILAQGLTPRLGQQVVVENRPGATGTIGSAAVARARPDGHVLVMGGVNTHAMNDSLFRRPQYDSARDFAPISLTARIPIAFVVNPAAAPVATLAELMALARARPGALSYGSSGAGGPQHLAMELFKQAAGLDILHVPYNGGGPQLTDLLAGRIALGSIGLPPVLPHVESGRLRALAATGERRTPLLPGLPTVAESGLAGFAVDYWLGLLAPAGTPEAVLDRLHAETAATLAQPAVQDAMARQGAEVAASTRQEFERLIAADIARWSDVVRKAGLNLD
jgi:tripartite-type tricarboxylate transporter receptor subunit TctC